MFATKLVVIGAAAALGAAGTGIAVASGVALPFSGDGNTINGCYSNGGAVKLLTPTQSSCPDGFAPIQWNVTGPPGPKGDPGTTPTLAAYSVAGPNVNVDPLAEIDQSVGCNGNDLATGGGYFLSSDELRVRFSVGGQHVWEVDVQNPSANSGFAFRAVVQCLKVSQ